MIRYDEMRKEVVNGDLLLVKGEHIGSKLIRAFTGETFSHVALLFWMEGGLWVAEYVGKPGFRMLPASQWFALYRKDTLFYGTAPNLVREAADTIRHRILKYRDKPRKDTRYGFLTLPVVWVGQLFGAHAATRREVCSTFVEDIWDGYWKFVETPDPGDCAAACQRLVVVEG